MNRKILFLLTITFLFVSCTNIKQSVRLNPPTKSFVKIKNTIEILKCKEKLPEKMTQCPHGLYSSTGSGMSVSVVRGEPIVITAGHVCSPPTADFITEHKNYVRVQDHKGIWHQAHIIKSTLDNSIGTPDMCALWVPSLENKGVFISRRAPIVGEQVYYIGAPAGIYHPPTAPILTGIFSGPIDASSSMITAAAVGGASGSVILTTENKMVGVLFAVHPQIHHVTIVTSYRSTIIFLNEVRKAFKKN
tara:strand:- start:2456 stop:3196 length:741 start_codon:yes stop_codon:yes gene_type:complete